MGCCFAIFRIMRLLFEHYPYCSNNIFPSVAFPGDESRKTALEQEIRRLSAGMPDLKPEYFECFMRRFGEFDKSEQDKQNLIDTLVSRVIVYPKQLVILINVTDATKIPPIATDHCRFGGFV